MSEIIAIPETDNLDIQNLMKQYLRSPSEESFHRLLLVTQENNQTGLLVELLYSNYASQALNATVLKQLIIALYVHRRLVEAVYFCEIYFSNFTDDKDLLRIYCSTCIDALFLGVVNEAVLKLETAGEARSITLLLKLGIALRLGQYNVAHDIAIEMLLYESLPNELCYDAVLQCAIRVDDIDILVLALLQLKQKGFRITCGKNNVIKMRQKLIARIAHLLYRRMHA